MNIDKALFAVVDRAIGEALVSRCRKSKLESIDIEFWNDELLAEDAADVDRTINDVATQHGWTGSEYNATYKRLRDNRHHSY
jgi:hypothetical protein